MTADESQIHPQVIERNQAKTEALIHVSPALAFLDHRIMSAVLIPLMVPYFQKVGFCQTMMDESVIACALERYRLAKGGQFPESLAALSPDFLATIPHDVVSGEPLKYHAVDNAFTLYSIGWNEKDDGGEIVMKPNSTARDLSQGDWAWQPYR